MAMTIQAIPTTYKGHTYRSKLEAKWVVVFEALGIQFDYEPEARRTAHGNYLPDFYLPLMKGGTWVEFKPSERRVGPEDPRWFEFVLQRQQPMVIVFGLPNPYGNGSVEVEPGLCWKIFPTGETDHDYRLTMCAVCGTPGFEFEGRGARACPTKMHCYGRESADRGHNSEDPRIIAALVKARSEFVGVPNVPGRTLPDDVVDRLAAECHHDTKDGSSPAAWLSKRALSPKDREAVLLAWGRLVE